MPARLILLFFIFIIILTGCTTGRYLEENPPDKATATKGFHLTVPFFPQEKNQCGPASLAGILRFYGIEITPDEISNEIYLPRIKGTLNIDLVFYARSKGMNAEAYHGDMADLKKRISGDRPLLLFLNLGLKVFPAGHYIVVTGFDDKDKIIYAHSGSERDKPIRYWEFIRAWERGDFWTLLVTPKI
ncbi:MAG: C39 family peptidase [Nitrospirae bacterium]|nr:C39 family peptidase [Nitrospirota bacterium]